MTGYQVPVDDLRAFRRILAATDAILLDFDGPVCSVFAKLSANYVANQLRGVLAGSQHTELPDRVQKTNDPFEVLRYAAKLGHHEARFVEAALRAHEIEAVATAEPTVGITELVHAWSADHKLAIVSNNSTASINAYLSVHNLERYFAFVAGRTDPNPELLKPSPHLIREAVKAIRVPPSRTTLIGDSISDMQAAHAVKISVIGYANKSGKISSLRTAGADLIVTTLASLGAQSAADYKSPGDD